MSSSNADACPDGEERDPSELTREELEQEVRRLRSANREAREALERCRSGEGADEFYRHVFDHLPDAMFLVDVDHSTADPTFTFSHINATHERLSGLTNEKVSCRSPDELFDPEMAEHVIEQYRTCVRRQETISYVEQLHFPSSNGVWRTELEPIVEDGVVETLIGTSRPLSARDLPDRDAGRFRQILEASGYAVLITDPDGCITYANEAFEKMSGYARKEVIGETPNLLDSGEHDEAFFRDLWETISDGRVWSGEILNETRDGERYWARQTIAPVQTERGEIWSYVAIQQDVTRQKEEHRDRRRKSQAMDSAPLGIVMTDPMRTDRPIVYVNEGFERITGYDREEILGRNCRFLQGDETEEEPVRELRRAVEEERATTVELRNYRKDGTMFWNRVLISPMRDEEGNVTRFVGFQQDVTEEKQKAETLELFRETIDRSPDDIFVIDPDSARFLDVNQTVEETLGYTRAEMLGMRVHDINPPMGHEVEWNARREQVKREGPVAFVTEHRRKDGITFPVEIHADAVDAGGTTRIVASARDISDLQEAKREAQEWAGFLESVNDTMPGVLYQFKVAPDGTCSFPYISEGYEELTGVPPEAAEADYDEAARYVHPDDREGFNRSVEEIQDPPRPWIHEYRYRLPDGTVNWVLASSTPEEKPDGSVVWSGVLIDVTERKEAERALAENERRFRTLYEEANEPMVITALDDEILDLNPAAAEHLGYDADQLIGGSIARILPPERREDRSDSIIRDRLARHGKRLFNTEHLRADGTRIPVEVSQTLIDYQGREAVLSFTRDLSRLEWSRRRMRAIFDSTHSFIGLLDAEGRMLDLNRSILEAVEASQEELQGRSLPDLDDWWAADDERRQAERALDAARKGEFTRFQTRIRDEAGDERVIDFSLSPITDKQENLIYLVLEGRDVTDRERKKEELQFQEQRFRTLFEEAPIGLWEEDWSGAFEYLNELEQSGHVEDLRGYLEEHPEAVREAAGRVEILLPNNTLLDLTGAEEKKQLYENFEQIVTEDLYNVFKKELLALRSGKTSQDSKTTINTFDGETKYILRDLHVVPGHADNWSRIFVSYRDITDVEEQRRRLDETRRREERFRQLAETVGVIFWLYDPEAGEYLYLSADCDQVYGISCDALYEGAETLIDRVHPDDRDDVRRLFEERLDEGFEATYRMRVDEEWVWVHDRAYPVTHDGDLTMVAGIAEDVTENVERERKLNRQIEETERISKLKSDFVARTTHDLRTPLNAVLGHADLLRETDLTPEQLRELERITSAGRSMLHLTNDILDLDQIEHGTLELHEKPVRIRSVIEDVMALFRPSLRGRAVELAVSIDDSVPERVRLDPDRFKQILVNLVGNAVKFTDEGHVGVRVISKETDVSETALIVSVEDTGPGISPEKQEAIFQSHEKGGGEGLRAKAGAGLGLSITQNLVRIMGGDIEVDSEPGSGTTFTFEIQVDTVEEAPDVPRDAADEISLEDRHVLVVDDSAPIRALMQKVLEPEGVRTSTASSAAEALDLMLGSDPIEDIDVVILDRRLGDGSGVEVLTRLAASESGPETERVYVLSGDARESVRSSLPDVPIAGVLEKPIDQAVLKDSIRSVLRQFEQPGETSPTPLDLLEGASPHVLVAEDNPEAREILERFLAPVAGRTTAVSCGGEAVRKRFADPPDVVLMDLQMPSMGGLDAIRTIREREDGEGLDPVPIIVQTAQAMKDVETSSHEAGADVFLKKPIDRDTLYETLISLME